MHLISKSLLFVSFVFSLLSPVGAAPRPCDALKPTVFSVSPTVVNPGGTVQCTITCDGIAGADTDISVASSSSGLFTDLPATVTVEAGHDSVTFYATLSTSASGSFYLTASASGGSVSSPPQLIHS